MKFIFIRRRRWRNRYEPQKVKDTQNTVWNDFLTYPSMYSKLPEIRRFCVLSETRNNLQIPFYQLHPWNVTLWLFIRRFGLCYLMQIWPGIFLVHRLFIRRLEYLGIPTNCIIYNAICNELWFMRAKNKQLSGKMMYS